MESLEPSQISNKTSGYFRSFLKAIDKTHRLLYQRAERPDYEEIHAVKSAIYVAIERAGMEAERSSFAQQKFRELLWFVTAQGDPSWRERQEALQILTELKNNISRFERKYFN